MHFLKIIIKTPQLEDPANKFFEVHRHFYRYSKGVFIGPALIISQTKAKLTLKGSHEYEDLIQEVACKAANDSEFNVTGVLETGKDLSKEISNLGLEWKLKKGSGQKKIYKSDILDTIDKNTFLEAIELFRKTSYLLLSFNNGPANKITTKKRIPQPSKKKVEDDEISKRVQFCVGNIANSNNNMKLIIESALSDFASELPETWKKITVTNNYKISGIEVPKDEKNSMLMRIKAIRKGKMIRSLEIDGELIEKQYNIVV